MGQRDVILDFALNAFQLRRGINERAAKRFGLSSVEIDILSYLCLYPDYATAADIVRERNIKKNTLSDHVENLVQRGLLKRVDRQDDRRKVTLKLTEEGEKIAAKCLKEHDALKRELFAGLDGAEIDHIYLCLDKIYENSQRLLEHTGGQ